MHASLCAHAHTLPYRYVRIVSDRLRPVARRVQRAIGFIVDKEDVLGS